MKAVLKILLLCLLIFGLGLYITKKSIDHTFDKVHSSQVVDISLNNIFQKSKEV